jgi:hypothetical protein
MPDTSTLAPEELRNHAEPMKPLVDPAQWTGKDLGTRTDWRFVLTPEEVAELDKVVSRIMGQGIDIKDVTAEDFPLPLLDAKLADIKHVLMDGTGIVHLTGVPVGDYDIAQSAAAFWCLGLRVGSPVSQNYKGHVLGHVADLLGPDRGKNPSYRAYHTSAELGYHSDSCDVAGLICLHAAKSGGGNRLASTVAIYNEMLKRRPDLVALLVKPWYRDRREEIPPGKDPWFELPIFNFAEGYFSSSWQNYYIRSAQRFDELPRFTDLHVEALDMIDSLGDELCFEITTSPGDVLFMHNHVTVHARSAYEDWPDDERRRHLLRLWLATPGGRPLSDAFLDRYVGLKPGQRPSGIVVEGMELCAPLSPE